MSERERPVETPEDVVYEALRTTLALRGVEEVSKSADKGLRLIAEVTAREVIRRALRENAAHAPATHADPLKPPVDPEATNAP